MNALYIDNELFVPVSSILGAINTTYVVFNSNDFYPKMGNRNRFRILTANGIATLTVPLKGGRNKQQAAGQIEIDYSTPWQRNHLRTLQSAYGRAPFFEHYYHDIVELYRQAPRKLWDWNLLAWHLAGKWLGCHWEFLDLAAETPITDNSLSKFKAPTFDCPPYRQVFGQQFVPNLSFIDAILNLGPSFRLHHAGFM